MSIKKMLKKCVANNGKCLGLFVVLCCCCNLMILTMFPFTFMRRCLRLNLSGSASSYSTLYTHRLKFMNLI